MVNQEPREVGRGVAGDPLLIWRCSYPTHHDGRTEGIENICRDACRITGSTVVWIRSIDHRTTRTRTRGGFRFVRSDPHITVYMGRTMDDYEYEGHLYVTYDRGVPVRLAQPSEREIPRNGPNPELFYKATRRRVDFHP